MWLSPSFLTYAPSSTPHAALALRSRLRASGYPAEILQKDKYFAVQVSRLAGEREARSLISAIRSIDGVDQPTVHEGS